MSLYPSRDLHVVGERRTAKDLLESLLIVELMSPGPEFWIVSAWVSDIEIVDNSARQYGTLCPEWPVGPVRLSQVLLALMSRGTTVYLCTNEDSHNDAIIHTLQAASEDLPGRFVWRRAKELHQKGILGTAFVLDGSMNLTFNGVYVNDEHVIFRTDPAVVAERRLQYHARWGVEP